VEVAQNAVKEKVYRVILATLRVSIHDANYMVLDPHRHLELGHQSSQGKSSSYAGIPTPAIRQEAGG
jgi:hypothetical protein